MQEISQLKQLALNAINDAADLSVLEKIRLEYLGKKGQLTAILRGLNTLSPEEKPRVGQLVNQLKHEVSAAIEKKAEHFKAIKLEETLNAEALDVTLPGRHSQMGSLHPISQMREKINDYFLRLGFDIVSGPEIETEFYNFEALNIPPKHPARAMHDTFYFGDGRLLRTHTSPVQIHVLENSSPPLRLIAPGRVYRVDSDLTHTPMFHQIEGMLIDKEVTLAHLKATLHDFFVYFFEKKLELRFRPSYFPFTEPSAEVDITCTLCMGSGCRACKNTGWLEILGCGMIHPQVLKTVENIPEGYQGWAFGMGIDRLTMLYFGIEDLRTMFENDLMFLQQF